MKLRKLTPSFSVESVVETVNFYQDILEFRLDMCVTEAMDGIDTEMEEDGEYVYAMVTRDDLSFIFVRDDHFQHEVLKEEEYQKGVSLLFYIDVSDIEEMYHCLVDKEIEIIKDLETTWYGMREFFIKDNNGYILCFSEQV